MINRSPYLSTKTTKDIDIIKSFEKFLSGNLKKLNSIIVVLQKILSFRSISDMSNSIEFWKKLNFLISAKENKPKLFKDLIIKHNRLVSVTNEKYLFQNRQCFSKTYRPNRVIFIFSNKTY